MMIPIPVRFQYKEYPFAPRATQKSKALGVFTSVPMKVVYSFLWVAILAALLENFMEYETGMIIGFISLIPFVKYMRSLIKRANERIDAQAVKEAAERMKQD